MFGLGYEWYATAPVFYRLIPAITMQMSTVSFLVGAPALPTLLVASSDKASVGHRLLKAPSAYDLHRKQFDVRLYNFRAVLVRAAWARAAYWSQGQTCVPPLTRTSARRLPTRTSSTGTSLRSAWRTYKARVGSG